MAKEIKQTLYVSEITPEMVQKGFVRTDHNIGYLGRNVKDLTLEEAKEALYELIPRYNKALDRITPPSILELNAQKLILEMMIKTLTKIGTINEDTCSLLIKQLDKIK